MVKLKILLFLFVLTIFFSTSFIESSQVKKVHNTLDEIKACEGEIIATKRLNHSCDKIKIHKDRLFVLDSYLEMTIYQYKIRF